MRTGGVGWTRRGGSYRLCDELKVEQARKLTKPTRRMSHHPLPEDPAARAAGAFRLLGSRFPHGS
jgi:hypothetical protein